VKVQFVSSTTFGTARWKVCPFESIYEPELQMTMIDKRSFLRIRSALRVVMLVDGALAGEVFGATLSDISAWQYEPIRKEEMDYLDSFYVMATTVLPTYQGKGLGHTMVAYTNGLLSAKYAVCTGHVTSPSMKAIRERFGAQFGPIIPNWYQTDRTAQFYVQRLYI
jgi:hypothetical protein